MDLYPTLKWLHLIAAALVLGLFAAYPFLPSGIPRDAADRAVVRHALQFLHLSSTALLIPSVVVLFLTGVLMSVGPFSEWTMLGSEGQWIVAGMFLWTIMSALVAGLMLGVVREMMNLAETGELAGTRMRQLWKQFRWGYFIGAAVTLATFWVMVFQPVFF